MGRKSVKTQFRFNSAEMSSRVNFLALTSAEEFKQAVPYNLFYRFSAEYLGILYKNGRTVIAYFSTRAATSDIGLNRLGVLSSDLASGYYLVDARRERIIYDYNNRQPEDEGDFGYSPYPSGDCAKLLILREDKQRAIFAYRQSPIVTMCYFITAISKFIKPSNDVNTLRGIILLVEFLHRQNPSLKKPDIEDIKNFLHVLTPQTKDWGLKVEQTNKVTDIIISTMIREPLIKEKEEEEEKSFNDKIIDVFKEDDKEPLKTIQLTDLIQEGFDGKIDTTAQVEIIIDIKLEGHLSAILEMYTEHGIIWVYTHDKKNITAEVVQDALDLPVELDNILVVDYMDIS